MEYIAGIDEVGRGSLSGAVVSAAVILPEGFTHDLIKDSKKLSKKKREAAYDIIQENAISIGVGIVGPEEIDRINILKATFVSMRMAIIDLPITPTKLMVDGNQFPGFRNIPFECIIKGDDKVPSISAASIVAKVTRDRMMIELGKGHPQYKWASNFGYGTKAHIDAIKEIGICQHHRKTFCTRLISRKSIF